MLSVRNSVVFLGWCLVLGMVVPLELVYNQGVFAAPPAQATPTATAAPSEIGEPAITTSRTVNIRSGPGTSYRILGVARTGESYLVTGKNGAETWWRIDYEDQAGWVFAKLVKAENVADVPLALVQPQRGSTVGTSSTGGTVSASGSGGGSADSGTGDAQAPAAKAVPASPMVSFDPQKVKLRLETVYNGLGQPTFVTNAGDRSGRMFVLERAGRIKVFAAANGEGTVFLDIEDRVDDTGPEQGLLGLAFAPDYASSGRFYVNYTDNQGDTVVARYRVSDDPNAADRESEQQLLWVDQPAPNHNGGMLVFGPDGRLWVGLGDGGGANDSFGSGQNPNTLLAKIVRLDVRGDSATSEIWATGLRNPWRFSFDRKTGDLWIGDVGQDLFEEINFVAAGQAAAGGLNFGWPLMEGAHCRGGGTCDTSPYEQPIFEYGHAGNGCSITGGHVYRGGSIPSLQGVYLYADFCSGHIWGLWRASDGSVQNALLLPNAAAISSFGEDEAGELYVTDFGGVVHRISVAQP